MNTEPQFENLSFLDREWKCRYMLDQESDDNYLLIAPIELDTALKTAFPDYETDSEYISIDEQICYYASPEEMLLNDVELFNVIYN